MSASRERDIANGMVLCLLAPRRRQGRLFADKGARLVQIAFRNRLLIRRQRHFFQVAPDRGFVFQRSPRVQAPGRLKSQPMQTIRCGHLLQNRVSAVQHAQIVVQRRPRVRHGLAILIVQDFDHVRNFVGFYKGNRQLLFGDLHQG